MMAMLCLWTGLGLFSGRHENISFDLFYILPGLFLFVFHLYRLGRSSEHLSILPFFAVTLLALWISGKVWGRDLLNPLFLLKLSVGQGQLDMLMEIATCNMIKTYNFPSGGIDGIPFMHYHIGSHWLFAQLSKLLHISATDFYNLAGPVVFYPLFLRSFMMCVLDFQKYYFGKAQITSLTWIVFAIAIAGIVPATHASNFILGMETVFTSMSFCVSLGLMFLLFSFALTVIEKEPRPRESINARLTHAFILIILFLAWFGILEITKIMTWLTALAVIFYVCWRRHWFSHHFIIFFAMACTVGVTLAIRPFIMPSGLHVFEFFYFFRHCPLSIRLYSPLIPFTAIAILSGLIAWQYRGASAKDFLNHIRAGDLIDWEISAITLIIAFLNCSLFSLYGGACYFLTLQEVLTLAFVCARLPYLVPKIQGLIAALRSGSATTRQNIMGTLAIGLLSVSSLNVAHSAMRFFIEDPYYLLEGLNFANTRPFHHQLADPHGALIRSLASLDSRSLIEKRETALYVPHSNGVFWSHWPGTLPQIATPFLIPALTGSALIFGMPKEPTEYYDRIRYWSDPVIGRRSDKEICAAAAAIPARRVLVLDSGPAYQTLSWSQVDCATNIR